MVPVIIADAGMGDLGEVVDCSMEVAFGVDENTLSITAAAADVPPLGGYAYVDGTEYGGTVDEATVSTESGLVTARGRSWHGILAGKRLLPDDGDDRLTVSGDAPSVLRSLALRMGLDGLFAAPESESDEGARIAPYSFERFADGYSGIRSMLAANGLKLTMRVVSGTVLMGARAVETIGSAVDSDAMDFDATLVARRTNHLVCGGTGEGADSTVIHFYANASGEVSHEQTLFGVDEIAAFYDYTNADAEKLEDEGRKKLEGLQGDGTVDVGAVDDIEADVGDLVTARDNATGIVVTAEISKKIARFEDGVPSYGYEVGTATEGTSNSTIQGGGGGSSSSGGHAYYAGRGLSLEGWTFSADVAKEDMDAASERITSAENAASNASAAAGEARKAVESHASDKGNPHGVTASQVGAAPEKHAHSASDITSGTISSERLPSIPVDKLDGVIPSANLPSYVDDVVEGTLSAFPKPGESGKVYTDTQTNKVYRWSGSSYVEISASLALGETSATAYRGDRGKTAYDHSVSKGNPHGTTAEDVGASPDGHKHSAADLTSGTLPISRGGTGATTAKAAEYAIHGKPDTITSEIVDTSTLSFAYASPNSTNGTFFTRTALKLWEYIKEKADAAYAKLSHTHTKSQITDFPTSMPASDVYSWAKAKEKPAYTASEVGAAPSDHSHAGATQSAAGFMGASDKKKLDGIAANATRVIVDSALSSTSVNAIQNKAVNDALGKKADATHTHRYAGSSSPGGAATSAEKLATARKITFSGAAKGSVSFDGSKDVTVTLEGDGAAAQFLAAHPVGSVFETTKAGNPSDEYGGEWRALPSVGGYKWERTS